MLDRGCWRASLSSGALRQGKRLFSWLLAYTGHISIAYLFI
jgi:hypothetical protein